MCFIIAARLGTFIDFALSQREIRGMGKGLEITRIIKGKAGEDVGQLSFLEKMGCRAWSGWITHQMAYHRAISLSIWGTRREERAPLLRILTEETGANKTHLGIRLELQN